MKAIKFYKYIFGIILILQSCNLSDSTEKLGGGYFYRNEGTNIKDILSEKPNGGQIPAKVINYAYNEDFIIAKQKPKIPQDPLYDINYEYKNGSDEIYYWLVVKNEQLVLGPMDVEEFKEAKLRYRVPDELKFK